MLTDVDGDKKADVLLYYWEYAGWYVIPSTGTSFANAKMIEVGLGQGIWLNSFADTADPAAGDINGDGKADLVAFSSPTLVWTTSICR